MSTKYSKFNSILTFSKESTETGRCTSSPSTPHFPYLSFPFLSQPSGSTLYIDFIRMLSVSLTSLMCACSLSQDTFSCFTRSTNIHYLQNVLYSVDVAVSLITFLSVPAPGSTQIIDFTRIVLSLCVKDHFTHEPNAKTMKCPKPVSRHLQTHVVWSRTLKCSVNS